MTQRILFAAPEPALVAQVAAALEEAGFAVSTALDGDEALKRADEAPPDLACLDLDIAKTSALDVCERLKATRTVPVLIAAEFLDDATSAGYSRVKADDLVFKPFSIAEIVDKVAWYLNPED